MERMSSSLLALSLAPATAIENFFTNNGDQRVANLRFMESPWEVLLISLFYVYFCYDLGPNKLMKNREPFDLVWTVRIFNSFILMLNVWILSKFFTILNWGYDSIGCAPVNLNDKSDKGMEQISVCHIFLYSRILELIDTLWITLRKKNRQITFLHVFHHSFVLLMTWFYFRLAPGGSSSMFPIVNGMVHTIMYSYYTLSTFESVKPYLWWKKYVTTIQLAQFIALGLHFSVAALTPNCGYPKTLSLTGVAISCMFFVLFAAFYKETYSQRKKLNHLRQQAANMKHLMHDSNNNNNNNYCGDECLIKSLDGDNHGSQGRIESSETNNNNHNLLYKHKLTELKKRLTALDGAT